MQIHKLLLRSIAALIAAITVFGSSKFENSQNLLLYISFIFSLLAFCEYKTNDLLQKINVENLKSGRVEITFFGKILHTIALFLYGIYFIKLIF